MLHEFGATIAAPRVVSTNSFFSNVRSRETDRGTHLIEGVRIFKAGTFADSMGIVRTWEESHLEQMAFHYNLLKEGEIFPNVPVRADHTKSVQSVVGYFDAIYRDPEDPTFLAADIEFTEPDAFQKWERGTFRSRSCEIGMYETNEESAYWPVVMGLAFVDIPAIEGLYGKGSTVPPQSSEGDKGRATFNFSQQLQDDNKENPEVDHETFKKACEYAQALDDWSRAATYAQAVDDWVAAADYAAALDAHQAQGAALGLTADHSRGNLPPATFRVNGQQTADPGQVQTHITALEEFQRETIETGRREFVDSLAQSGRIAATQVDSMQALVQTMNGEQFAAFQKSYEGAAPASLFGHYGDQGQGGDPAGGGGGAPTQVSEIETLEEIVANHRRAGKTPEQIEKLSSFQKLQTLKTTQGS